MSGKFEKNAPLKEQTARQEKLDYGAAYRGIPVNPENNPFQKTLDEERTLATKAYTATSGGLFQKLEARAKYCVAQRRIFEETFKKNNSGCAFAELDKANLDLFDIYPEQQFKFDRAYSGQFKPYAKEHLGLIRQLSMILGALCFERFFVGHQNPTIKVISLGCGIAHEILPLQRIITLLGFKMEYVGIDINQSVITDNKQIYFDFEEVAFHCADATDLKALRLILADQKFDFGILRNADFSGNNRNHIFAQMINKSFPALLAFGKPLYLSFYTEKELTACGKESEIFNKERYTKPDQNCLIVDNPREVQVQQNGRIVGHMLDHYNVVFQSATPSLTASNDPINLESGYKK